MSLTRGDSDKPAGRGEYNPVNAQDTAQSKAQGNPANPQVKGEVLPVRSPVIRQAPRLAVQMDRWSLRWFRRVPYGGKYGFRAGSLPSRIIIPYLGRRYTLTDGPAQGYFTG